MKKLQWTICFLVAFLSSMLVMGVAGADTCPTCKVGDGTGVTSRIPIPPPRYPNPVHSQSDLKPRPPVPAECEGPDCGRPQVAPNRREDGPLPGPGDIQYENCTDCTGGGWGDPRPPDPGDEGCSGEDCNHDPPPPNGNDCPGGDCGEEPPPGDDGGGGGDNPVPTPPPQGNCAAPWVARPQIAAQEAFRPNYPVVAGQDPEGRGVDIQLAAQVSPAVYHFQRWQPIRWADGCRKSEEVSDVCEGQRGRRPVRIPLEWGCVWHSVAYPDIITVFEADYALDGASIDWIAGPLQERYPGAKVKGGPYPKLISWHSKQGLHTHAASAEVQKLGLVDPGKYWVALVVRTSGTPVSSPVSKKFLYSLQVHLRDETITR